MKSMLLLGGLFVKLRCWQSKGDGESERKYMNVCVCVSVWTYFGKSDINHVENVN